MKSSQVRIDSLGTEGQIGNARTYKRALQKVPAKLHARPEAVGMVVGYYYKEDHVNVLKERYL